MPKANSAPSAPSAATPTMGTAAALGMAASLIGICASIIKSKATAIYLGPEGIGMAAEIQQLATLALVPIAAFSGPALVQSLAKEKREGGEPRVVATAATWLVTLGGLLAVFVTLISGMLLPSSWGSGKEPLVALALLSGLSTGAIGVPLTMLVSEARLAQTTKLQIGSAVVGATLVAVLTATFGLSGQFLATTAAPILILPWLLSAARSSSHWPKPVRFVFDRQFLGEAMKIGAASLIAAASIQVALFSIRWTLELEGGPQLNGQFQASWGIGSVYLGMILGGVGSFVFPRYALARNQVELQAEVDRAAEFVTRIAPPFVLLALAFADIGVHVLYSNKFDTAISILGWQLAGDAAKCLSWVYAGPLLFRGRVRAYIVTEFVGAGTLAIASFLLVRLNGPVGAGQAYLATYVIYLPVAAWALRRSLAVQAQGRHLSIVAAWTAAYVFFALSFRDQIGYRIAAVLIAAVWLWRTGQLAAGLALVRRKIRGQTHESVP